VKPENKHREIYLTDAIAVLASKGETVLAQVAPDPREVLGCNTRADLGEVDHVFRERKREELMDAGVTIQLPETVLVGRTFPQEKTRCWSLASSSWQNETRRALRRPYGQRFERHDSRRRRHRRAALRHYRKPHRKTMPSSGRSQDFDRAHTSRKALA